MAACSPLGPAPTPTLVPLQLPDAAMQQAALSAVQEYANRLDYPYRSPSFSIVAQMDDRVIVHATVAFQTRKGFPYEEHDALLVVNRKGAGWEVEPIKKFSKLEWEVDLERGPKTLNSPAGFTVSVPAGWAGYVAPQSELKPANVCGVGMEPREGVPILLVMPAGYSAENVPVILRGFQQCPRAPGLGVIRQWLENMRDTDKSLYFEQLEMLNLAGRPVLVAVVTDATGTRLYDYYVLHRERQLEFIVQVHAGQDVTQVLAILNGIQFN